MENKFLSNGVVRRGRSGPSQLKGPREASESLEKTIVVSYLTERVNNAISARLNTAITFIVEN